jgi:general secretion pathway protein K
MKNRYAARGACIYAMRRLLASEGSENEKKAEDENTGRLKRSIPLADNERNLLTENKKELRSIRPWAPGSRPYSIQIGEKNCKVFISDEGGKININKITDENKVNFTHFLISHKIDRITAETITDSLLDWVDADDLQRMSGAEKEYYASLQEPYEPRNAPFESVEELALVKGVTPQIFQKIRDHLTIYGSGKINVNFASREVLCHVPMITPDAAEAIIQLRRKQRGIESLDHLKDILSRHGVIGKDYQKIINYFTVSDSSYLTIHSIAFSDNGKSSYKVIVQKSIDGCKIIAVYP